MPRSDFTLLTIRLKNAETCDRNQARTGHANASTLLDIYSHALQSAQDQAAQTLCDVLLPSMPSTQSK